MRANPAFATIVTYLAARESLFRILHKPLPFSRPARYLNYGLFALILINAIAVALETVPSIHQPNRALFFWLEAVSTSVFAVEYLLRLWVCVEQTRFSHPITGRLRYALQPLPLLDLIVVLTFFAPVDVRFLRIFRIIRLLRVLHLDIYERSIHQMALAIHRRRHILLASVVLMLIAIFCSAALLYFAEHAAQPDKFSSIPETLWWSVVTLTTIGYGDVIPITPLGKLLAGMSVIFGIGIFALPAAILTAAVLEAGGETDLHCPHCGRPMR